MEVSISYVCAWFVIACTHPDKLPRNVGDHTKNVHTAACQSILEARDVLMEAPEQNTPKWWNKKIALLLNRVLPFNLGLIIYMFVVRWHQKGLLTH